MSSFLRQSGTTTVEFAIAATVLMVVLVAILDLGRLYFAFGMLNEGTRRGVRLAAVCPVNDPAIARAAVFDTGSGGSPVVNGLQTGHIVVEYLDSDGAPVASPGGSGFRNIRYVRVRIGDAFQLPTVVPGLSAVIPAPDFTATLPRESLGVPREGAIVPC